MESLDWSEMKVSVVDHRLELSSTDHVFFVKTGIKVLSEKREESNKVGTLDGLKRQVLSSDTPCFC